MGEPGIHTTEAGAGVAQAVEPPREKPLTEECKNRLRAVIEDLGGRTTAEQIGISRPLLSRLMNGERCPGYETARRIARYLDMTMEAVCVE
jgi:plasmid maintenance system antidote protein VapI